MFQKTPKKIPVKGVAKREVKETICSECRKNKPYANKTKRLCSSCVKKLNVQKAKEKKDRERRKKAETVTQAKLDQVTSWLIRAVYEEKCHACGKEMQRKHLQCCHFVSRTKTATRFDLHNMLPGCQVCNMYTPHHVWELGKYINKLWGEDKTEILLELAGKQLKLNNSDRKEIYVIYKNSLDRIETNDYSLKERIEILKETYFKYLDIVKPLIK